MQSHFCENIYSLQISLIDRTAELKLTRKEEKHKQTNQLNLVPNLSENHLVQYQIIYELVIMLLLSLLLLLFFINFSKVPLLFTYFTTKNKRKLWAKILFNVNGKHFELHSIYELTNGTFSLNFKFASAFRQRPLMAD